MQRVGLASVLLTLLGGFFLTASAERFTGGSYTIDASVVGNSFGGATTGGSYKLTSSGGESVIGQGSGGSYKLGYGYVAQLESSLQLTVQPGGLIGYYPLDVTSNAVYDNSANTASGQAVASPTTVSGKVGSALNFNGTTQYASLGTTSSFTGTTFTLESWVKTTNNAAVMGIITKGSNFWLGINVGKAAIYDWTAGSTCQASTAPSLGDGAWHHVAATLVNGSVNGSIIYIDGVQQKTCTWAPTAQNGEVGLGASKAASWQQFFDGTIDEVKIYSRAMSANEIKAEYDAGVAGNASGLSFASSITPGISQTSNYDAVVMTDASNGYNLSVSQNQNLTKGADTIAAVSGSIASPVTWVEGTTKGLGFTLYGTNATALPGKWSSGAAYAAFPGSGTSYYVRTGKPSSKDVLNMRLRLDVPSTQVSGSYTNVITTTGTITP
jgi:hypothetical protein